MNAAMSKAVRRNWARANKLAELAGIPASKARNFLAQATDDAKALLDNGADRRNKAVRTLIFEAQAHAGLVKATDPRLKPEPDPKHYESDIKNCEQVDFIIPTPTAVPIELLFDLRGLVKRYGEPDVVAAISTYLYLQTRVD